MSSSCAVSFRVRNVKNRLSIDQPWTERAKFHSGENKTQIKRGKQLLLVNCISACWAICMPICCQCVGEQKYLFFVFVGAGRDTSDLALPFFNTQVALDRDSSDRTKSIYYNVVSLFSMRIIWTRHGALLIWGKSQLGNGNCTELCRVNDGPPSSWCLWFSFGKKDKAKGLVRNRGKHFQSKVNCQQWSIRSWFQQC